MKSPKTKEKVLFICNRNAARSQMAEGLLRSLYGEYYDVYSAGNYPSTLSHYAVEVMAEIGVDISKHRSKSLKEFEGTEFDHVVTVCDGDTCPYLPGGKNYLHKSFKDPAGVKGTKIDKIKVFRGIRDEIKGWIEETFRKP
jgi:arsenate reductase (thioredoxin)